MSMVTSSSELPLNNLQRKISLVQEILTILECTLASVKKAFHEAEESNRLQPGPGSLQGVLNSAHSEKSYVLTKHWMNVIGEGINRYFAFENILRTAEENCVQQNDRLPFPDLSKIDKMVMAFQREKLIQWNTIKETIEELTRESNQSNHNRSNVVPLVTRVFQVQMSGYNLQDTNYNNISSLTTGKRPLISCASGEPPLKLLKISCKKNDAAATEAIQTNPLDIVKSLWSSNNEQILSVVDLGIEEERMLEGEIANNQNALFLHYNNGKFQNGAHNGFPLQNSNSQCSSTAPTVAYSNNVPGSAHPQSSYNHGLHGANFSSLSHNFSMPGPSNTQYHYNTNAQETNNVRPAPPYYNSYSMQSNRPIQNTPVPLYTHVHNSHTSNALVQPLVHFPNINTPFQVQTIRRNTPIPSQLSIQSHHPPLESTTSVSTKTHPIQINNYGCTFQTNYSAINLHTNPQPQFTTHSIHTNTPNTLNFTYSTPNHTDYGQSNTNKNSGNNSYRSIALANEQSSVRNRKSPDTKKIIAEIRPEPRRLQSSRETGREDSFIKTSFTYTPIAPTEQHQNQFSNATSTEKRNTPSNESRPSVIQISPLRSTPTAPSSINSSTSSNVALDLLYDHMDSFWAGSSTSASFAHGSTSISPVKDGVVAIEDSFEKLNLKQNLIEKLRESGVVKPRTFQFDTIKAILDGKNVILKACPLRGKTTSIMIAVIQKIDLNSSSPQAIILTNTKDDSLDMQKKIQYFASITSPSDNIIRMCVDVEMENISGKPGCGQIILGTPIATLKFLRKQNFRTETVKSLLIDSADKLLSQGLSATLIQILYVLNADSQVAMMVTEKTDSVNVFSKRLRNPTVIESAEEAISSPISDEAVETLRLSIGNKNLKSQETECSNKPTNTNASEYTNTKPKLIYKVKSLTRNSTVVEVRAVLPNNEEVELELEHEHSERLNANPLYPEEDPLAIPESSVVIDNSNKRESQLNPKEFSKSLKAQDILKKNPKFTVAFPDTLQALYNSILEEEEIENCLTSENVNSSQDMNANQMINRADFLNKKHFYVLMEEDDAKVETLTLLNIERDRSIIFCNSAENADRLSTKLRQRSLLPQVLHKDTQKKQRESILKAFGQRQFCRVLITTDYIMEMNSSVGVPLLINYDMPDPANNYVWRSRFASHNAYASMKPVMVVSFIAPRDLPELKKMEKAYGLKILPMTMEDDDSSRSSSPVSSDSVHFVEMDCESPD